MKKINSDITEFSDSELEIISRIKNDPVPGVFRDDMKKVCQTATSRQLCTCICGYNKI